MLRQTNGPQTSKARSATQLNPTIEKKILGYAALASATGVGVLALASTAEAEIIYTPTHQKIPINSNVSLDLNGDGIDDFVFRNRLAAPAAGPTFSTQTSAALLAYPVAKTNQAWGTAQSVSVLPAGVAVGPKGKFGPDHSFMGAASAVGGGAPRYLGPWAPGGASITNRYVGLKFVIDGQIHFGWARLSVEIHTARKGGVRAFLTGYAYETQVNQPIETGRTSGADVPVAQPAGLGQLAQGSAGLVPQKKVARREEEGN